MSNETELNYETIGRRVQARRKALGFSTKTLAERAGLARYTVIRLEQGHSCSPATIKKIRLALHMFTDQLTRPAPTSKSFFVHRAADTKWTVSRSKAEYQKQLVEDDPAHVNDEAERHRLGAVGFQPFFTAVLDSEIDGGTMGQAIMELHRNSWVDVHYGEEFVYCLRGKAKIRVDGDDCELAPGDAMTFPADKPHQYLPVEFDEQGRAPQILVVVAFRPNDRQFIRDRRNWNSQESANKNVRRRYTWEAQEEGSS
jgi:transcriptional regulator with XRE-family HTH domain